MNDNQKLVDELLGKFDAKLKEETKNFLTSDEMDKVKSDFTEAIKNMDKEALTKYADTIETLKSEVKSVSDISKEIKETLRAQGSEITTLKSAPKIADVRRKLSRKDLISATIKTAFNSKDFAEFEGRGFKGASNKMFLDSKDGNVALKDLTSKVVVDMSSHTGTNMISEISDVVTDDTPTRMSHVRDILNVSMTDQAQIVAGEVYDFTDALTLGAVMLAENGEAPESVFKSKENTWTLKRIANSMRISKREIKTNGLQWVIDKVMSKLPDATLFVEDVQLLFGDGVGNNVQGLAKDAQAFNLTPNTYGTGDFTSIAGYDTTAQTLVTFTAAHGMKNGDSLTLANTTTTTYDGTFAAVEVINSTQVVIDQAYTADANVLANWTGSSASPFYQAIDAAQEYDVLAVSDANLEAGEFKATNHILHPSQGTQMGLLKDTQGNYLNITKDSQGRIAGVNGKPIVYTTAMPFGKFFTGDFSRNGVELREFTPLNIQFVEDVESVKKNEIVVVIEEEIIFPIYNPFWFTYGKFATAKTALETP